MRLLLLLLLFPALALAGEVPAGFPQSSLWLSKLAPEVGETVVIHTVVYNSSESSISGSVLFKDADTVLGTKPFSVEAGETELISQNWTATEGTHTFAATLDGVSGATDALASTASAKVEITVQAPPPPPPPPPPPAPTPEPDTSSSDTSASAVTDLLASSSPMVSEITTNTFAIAEGVRASALVALERIASSTTKGEVLAAEDRAVTPEENVEKSFDIGATIQNIWTAFLNALLFVFRSPLLFYIFIGFVLFVVIGFVRTMLTDRKERD